MIVYQDRMQDRLNGPRLPEVLVGAATFTRRDCTSGDLITLGEPLGDLVEAPAGAAVLELPEGWGCWQVGEFVPAEHLRRAPGALDLLPIADAQGRAWHAPAILAPGVEPREGAAVLPLPWGNDEHGVPARIPTPAQARLIAAARSARAEILDGRLGQIPVPIAASLALPLLEAIYHLTGQQILGWQLADDALIASLLMASAGFLRPREQ